MELPTTGRTSAFDAYRGSDPCVGPEYSVSDAEGRTIAAKWRPPVCRTRVGRIGQNVLGYHIGGSTSVSAFIKGKCIGTGSQHGSISFRPHDLELESERGGIIEMLHLYLDQDMINQYARQNLMGTMSVDIDPVFAIRDPWLSGYFAMVVSEFELYGGIDAQAHSLLLAQSQQLLVRHMVHWHSNVMQRSRQAPDNSGPSHPLNPRRLRAVFDFIEANLASAIDLADIAALTGLSPNHFIRAFRAATQRTPYSYVVERRLERVTEALQTSDRPLAEIAHAAGFRNHSTLSTTFKRHYGVTPSAYRARVR